MAESIRGINIVIGAETTALTAALADVNRSSRNIQDELKQVERLLRLDPSNTELLAQRQTLLGNAIETSAEKLNRLRAAQEQVNQQFARGEINEAQYRAFQREVAASEQELRRFEDRLRDSQQAANNLGENLQKAGEKMKAAGEKMSIGITAPIVAAGGVMLKGAIDAENATSKLQAQLGLTAEEAADLGAVAQAVWVNGFGENVGEVNEAIKEVRQNMGILAEDELGAVTEGAMTIAEVFDQDVKEVTAAAGVVMKNFGIEGQDALDILTVGFQKGGDFSGELLDTMREYAPQFAAMGFTADQAMATLIAGAQQGAFNLDKVGDAAKESFLRLKDGSKTSGEAFQTIGLNAEKMAADISAGGESANAAFQATLLALAAIEDPVERDRASIALFGTTVEDLGQGVVLAMADGVKGLDNFKGATDAAAAAMYDNNPGLALTMALREVQAAIGPALLPLADIIKNTVVPAITELANGFKNLSPEGQKVVLVVAGIAAAIGPALILIGSMATGFTSVKGVLTTLVPKMASLVIGLGPIGIAIAAIVAAGVLLYMNWDVIKAKASELWARIVSYFESIKQTIGDALQNIISLFMQYHPIGIIISHWDEIREYLIGIASKAVSWGKAIVQGMIDGITGFIDRAVAAASDLADKISSTVKRILGIASPSTVMEQFGQYVAEGLAKGINDGQDDVRKAAENLAGAIKSAASAMMADLDRALQLNNATFSLQADAPGANKSSIELAKLQAQAESTQQKIEILTVALEKARAELGEDAEVTKDLSHQLAMSQIELKKTEQDASNLATAMSKDTAKATRDLQKSFSDLSEEIVAIETNLRSDLVSALKDYEQQVADTNTRLAANERNLTEEYERNLQSRADSLSNFVGMFDAVTPKEVSGDQLLENLRGQVSAFDDWQQNIAELAAKGVDEGLIDELRQMGPKAGPEIAALNTLTEGQLREYVSLWKDKNQSAREEATAQLSRQRVEMEKKLVEIRADAQVQLTLYKVEWEKKNAEIRKNAELEMARIEKKFQDIAAAGTTYGVALIQNFAKGMESQFEYLREIVEEAQAITGDMDPNVRHSPSLVDRVRSGVKDIIDAYQGISLRVPAMTPALVGGSSTSNHYDGNTNTFQIHIQGGNASDQADQLLRELGKRGVRF